MHAQALLHVLAQLGYPMGPPGRRWPAAAAGGGRKVLSGPDRELVVGALRGLGDVYAHRRRQQRDGLAAYRAYRCGARTHARTHAHTHTRARAHTHTHTHTV
jgi:hypothetical protein